MNSRKSQEVLIVDDEPDIRELLEITLKRMNLLTHTAADLASARKLLAQQSFHLCLTDMRLPDGDGLDLVKEIQKDHPHIPVAVITAHGSTETAITALKSGAFDFVSKPLELMKLRSLVTAALRLSGENGGQHNPAATEIPAIVGASRHIIELKKQISKLARSQAPIFISGESGTGKELVARAIHAQGPRKDKPFIAINCGAIPGELMESEFFGHIKGSFTGADQNKPGLFQAAEGGSLFLDEIADLPLHMQVKLLRCLQEKSIRPVGSQNEIPVDVRLISATHKNLAVEIEHGRLRQDLYYRINVIEIQVPPLRERLDDLPLLARHILDKLNREHGGQSISISERALRQLLDYDFPGNVRELENLLQRAYAMTDGELIEQIDFPRQAEARASAGSFSSLEKHLESIERQAMLAALEQTHWNKTAAARKLGMSFRSFRYRLKKLNIEHSGHEQQ